jgi:UDP-glucose 4-epimerase
MLPMLDQKNLNKQIINIGPDEEFVTINKIAEICSNITGSNLKPIYKKDRPREVKHASCSADKARKLLNYKTKTNLKNGILKTYNYIKGRGAKPFEYHINIEINNELTPEVWTKKEL